MSVGTTDRPSVSTTRQSAIATARKWWRQLHWRWKLCLIACLLAVALLPLYFGMHGTQRSFAVTYARNQGKGTRVTESIRAASPEVAKQDVLKRYPHAMVQNIAEER